MAKASVKVLGGNLQEVEATTVGEVKRKLNLYNYVAKLNGESCEDSDSLSEADYITLSAPIKGGHGLL